MGIYGATATQTATAVRGALSRNAQEVFGTAQAAHGCLATEPDPCTFLVPAQ